jgi:hypothetical protein
MSETKLCTEGDFALSEKLHSEYERAKQARAAAQPRVDAAADAYETACLHRHAAGSLCDGTPQARIEALDAEVADIFGEISEDGFIDRLTREVPPRIRPEGAA